MTSAAQLETTFAGAERAERQCRTGRRHVGQGRCHDQDHDSAGRTRQHGLPAARSEAGERRERGRALGSHGAAPATNGAVAVGQLAPSPRDAEDDESRRTGYGRRRRFSDEPVAFGGRSAPAGAPPAGRLDVRAATGSAAPQSAPGRAPRAEQCSGDAAAVNTPVVPVASHAVAQDRGAGHAGALLPRPDLSGNGSPVPAPPCAPVSAAPLSDERPAPQLAHRAPLQLVPFAGDRPSAAGRPGGWPGTGKPQVGLLCSSQNAPRPRTDCAAAVGVATATATIADDDARSPEGLLFMAPQHKIAGGEWLFSVNSPIPMGIPTRRTSRFTIP